MENVTFKNKQKDVAHAGRTLQARENGQSDVKWIQACTARKSDHKTRTFIQHQDRHAQIAVRRYSCIDQLTLKPKPIARLASTASIKNRLI